MKLITSQQMQELDYAAVHDRGVPSLVLMENAGRCVADLIQKRFPIPENKEVIIIAGKGNNGGDGLVAARYLMEAGYRVDIYILGEPDTLSQDSTENFKKLKDLKPNIIVADTMEVFKNNAETFKTASVVVDAIFGTGLNAEVVGKYRDAIQFINRLNKPIVAIDIPSGLSADTGHPLGAVVKATYTVTFGFAKVGLVNPPGNEFAGKIKVVDIGIPSDLTDTASFNHFLITPEFFKKHFKKREADSHKGTYGHAAVVAGSFTKIGAGLLAAQSALRAGAGLSTYILPEHAYAKYDSRYPEIMCEPVPDKGKGFFIGESYQAVSNLCREKNVVALGPGIGTDKETQSFVNEMMKLPLPIVIDADGLNCIAGNLDVLKRRTANTVLTPHPGEMSKLTGIDTKTILENRIELSRKFAQLHKIYLVLKGNRTLVATPEGHIYINPTGNAGMATAGMGDALTGVIAGFVAQGLPFLDAILAAVYIHGLSGDMFVEENSDIGLIASDVIKRIPKAIQLIRSAENFEYV